MNILKIKIKVNHNLVQPYKTLVLFWKVDLREGSQRYPLWFVFTISQITLIHHKDLADEPDPLGPALKSPFKLIGIN